MKWIERVCLAIVAIGLVFKFLHYPGASLLLIVSINSLSLVYAYFGFLLFNRIRLRSIFKKAAYAHVTVWSILGAIFMGFAMSVMLLGILFRLQYYPGAVVMLLTGSLFVGLGLIVYFVKFITKGSHFLTHNWYRVLPVFVLGLGFTISTMSGDSYQDRTYLNERMHQQHIESRERFFEESERSEQSTNALYEDNTERLSEPEDDWAEDDVWTEDDEGEW